MPFGHNARKGQVGPSVLPANQSVEANKLVSIANKLDSLYAFWKKQTVIQGALVNVEYTRVVAKSNRIRQVLTYGVKDINNCVKGAKFVGDESAKHHVITYHVPSKALKDSALALRSVANTIQEHYNGVITSSDIEQINMNGSSLWKYSSLKKSTFVNLIVDSFYINDVSIPKPDEHIENSNIVTIYNTGFVVMDKMNELGIVLSPEDVLDTHTVILSKDNYELLCNKAPFLVAMALTDFTKLSPLEKTESTPQVFSLGEPSNEPTIGVIDTFFEENVYFAHWVEVHDMIPTIGITDHDRFHGTAVDSLIVDGARINPDLEDGCGNFRVRHFSAITYSGYSSTSLTKLIRTIVEENRDIKVWNISLGSPAETPANYLSFEAAELDKLQTEFDIIFVVAGTNDSGKTLTKRIGSPADSINSLVVNSVNRKNIAASYSRRGPILSFYNKPDVSYYGGDSDTPIKVCSKNGETMVAGTSFAAPFIARKLAYLIHIMGLSLEVAKALIMDSTIGWTANTNENISSLIGLGVVPIHINDILHSKDDEIRFVLSGEATEYDNYCYNIPVPISKGKQPYIAKATLCYFPKGNREQGVDYTSTELDLHFGRIIGNRIHTINNNRQNTDLSREYEKDARSYHRKWDNTKVICETLKQRRISKDVKGKGLWGISIKKTERNSNNKHPVRFGMVVTLKNINGDNLIQDFIQQCAWNNLLVTPLHIRQQIEVYNKMTEEIQLE